MNILLTNDDGKESPLLPFTIEGLSGFGNVHTVVPESEQSWKGKSMSRFNHLRRGSCTVGGTRIDYLDGTPADCANAGIYHLCPEKPELVVSGINIGLNTGLAFSISSGTLGACFEANIAGITGIAFSQSIDQETLQSYLREGVIRASTAERLREQCCSLVARALEVFTRTPELMARGISWSVNFPFEPARETRWRVCPLGNSLYGSCFAREGDLFRHDVKGIVIDPDPHSDWTSLQEGYVTITPIDLKVLGKISQEDRARLQDCFQAGTNRDAHDQDS